MKRSARGLNIMADIMLDLTCVLGFEERREVVQNGLILSSGWQAFTPEDLEGTAAKTVAGLDWQTKCRF